MTSGTARPSACGQAMTSTVTTRSIDERAGVAQRDPHDERERPPSDGDDREIECGAVGERLGARARRLRLRRRGA